MKYAVKIHLPEVHVNPINRDLFLVVTTAMLVAVAFVTAVVMVISQI